MVTYSRKSHGDFLSVSRICPAARDFKRFRLRSKVTWLTDSGANSDDFVWTLLIIHKVPFMRQRVPNQRFETFLPIQTQAAEFIAIRAQGHTASGLPLQNSAVVTRTTQPFVLSTECTDMARTIRAITSHSGPKQELNLKMRLLFIQF